MNAISNDKSLARILILGRYISAFGGAHKYLLRLTQKLLQSGKQVCVGMNFTPGNSEFRQKLEDAGAAVAEVPFDEVEPAACGRVIDKLITDYSPTIIDCEAASKSLRYALEASDGMKRTIARKIFTMHLAIKSELANHNFTERFYPFSTWNRSRREIRRFLNLFDDAISVSSSHAARIEDLFALRKGFFTYIPNGVCPEDFEYPRKNSASELLIIGGCGGLTSQKRFDLLIDAMDTLVNKLSLPVRCRIAGDGVLRKDLEQQIDRLGLNEQVELLGHCADIPKFLADLDVFVMCSDHEGFPYAQLEAMASGLPSVVTDTGDLSLIVENGTHGYVTPIGDADKLASALEQLVNNPKLKDTFSRAARNKVETCYNAHIQEQISVNKLLAVTE